VREALELLLGYRDFMSMFNEEGYGYGEARLCACNGL
jgi:hypothetical protein